MSLSYGTKCERVLKLLGGLRNGFIVEQLREVGFQDADHAEGWRLLMAAASLKLAEVPALLEGPDVLAQLDGWENKWFPIVHATLQRRFPEVHERVFVNLRQTGGIGVIVGVRTLIDRILSLASGTAEEQQAFELVQQRGFNETVIKEAEELLQGFQVVAEVPDAAGPSRQEQEARVDEMWAWYLEWSAIIRSVIKSRRELRELGFLQPARRSAADEEPANENADASGNLSVVEAAPDSRAA